MLRSAACLGLLSAVLATGLPAQAVGSELDHYRAALALLADTSAQPWGPDLRQPPRWATGLNATVNTGFPVAHADGPVWTGRGATFAAEAEWNGRVGPLEVRLAPVIWWAQNVATSLIPPAGTAPNPFVDAMRPRAIDLPQRFGDASVARLDPGNTEIALRRFGLRTAFTSAAARLGAGQRHTIIMSPDAPGFPRVELGTDRRLRTPLGDFALTLAAGQIGQTPWAPQRREGSRSGAFFDARWRPFADDRLEFGGVRFYHQDWTGIEPGALFIPFGSLFFDAQTFGGGAADNQLLSLFGKLRLRDVGLELWGEFGLNDRQTDLRETVVELEHASAWMFGLRRAWQGHGQALWVLDVAAASGRVPPIEAFRMQGTFYEHVPISQGHTNRGQLLGSRLLERTGGVELRLDRYDPSGRIGLILGTRDLAQSRTLVVPEERLRREWSLLAEWLRVGPGQGLQWFARAGLIADLNRHPTFGDAYSAVLATGISLRR